MANQKSNDDSTRDAVAYFRSFGIEPIVIDPNDSKSVDKGLEEVGQRIQDAAKDLNEERK